MACPDDLTLDLWLADALPADEAAAIASHVHTCATCAAAELAARALGVELHAALALDDAELAYLTGLELAASWRTNPNPAAVSWGWIALVGVVASFAAWMVAAPIFGSAAAAAIQVGVGTVLLNAGLQVVFGFGETLVDLVRNPALNLSQPVLALLAL